ncbi:MAG: PRC-barrel domain-containing protein [Oscillospiraceae bacterium]|nr:PRC-barrel domain-containing protein [Oscillospiraceae bacterium]
MKKTKEIIGLPIISIFDGSEIGMVKNIIINAEDRSISFLVVENGLHLLGAKVISTDRVLGIGEHAVTVEDDNVISMISKIPAAMDLLEKNVHIRGSKVLTKKGKLVGEITEIYVDEDDRCRIRGMEFFPLRGDGSAKFLPDKCIVTYGRHLVIVSDTFESAISDFGDISDMAARQQVAQDSEVAQRPATPGLGQGAGTGVGTGAATSVGAGAGASAVTGVGASVASMYPVASGAPIGTPGAAVVRAESLGASGAAVQDATEKKSPDGLTEPATLFAADTDIIGQTGPAGIMPERVQTSSAALEFVQASGAAPERAETSGALPQGAASSGVEPQAAASFGTTPQAVVSSGTSPQGATPSGFVSQDAGAAGVIPGAAQASGAMFETAAIAGSMPEAVQATGAAPSSAEITGAAPVVTDISGAVPQAAATEGVAPVIYRADGARLMPVFTGSTAPESLDVTGAASESVAMANTGAGAMPGAAVAVSGATEVSGTAEGSGAALGAAESAGTVSDVLEVSGASPTIDAFSGAPSDVTPPYGAEPDFSQNIDSMPETIDAAQTGQQIASVDDVSDAQNVQASAPYAQSGAYLADAADAADAVVASDYAIAPEIAGGLEADSGSLPSESYGVTGAASLADAPYIDVTDIGPDSESAPLADASGAVGGSLAAAPIVDAVAEASLAPSEAPGTYQEAYAEQADTTGEAFAPPVGADLADESIAAVPAGAGAGEGASNITGDVDAIAAADAAVTFVDEAATPPQTATQVESAAPESSEILGETYAASPMQSTAAGAYRAEAAAIDASGAAAGGAGGAALENGAAQAEVIDSEATLFEQKQRRYLTGRVVTKTILDNKGNVLVEEGVRITEDIIDTVRDNGRMVQLVMNNRA